MTIRELSRVRATDLLRNAWPGRHNPLPAWRRRCAFRADVASGVVAAIALVGVAGFGVWAVLQTPPGGQPATEAKSLAAAIVAGGVAVFVAAMGGIVKVTTARQNLITLFSSEIRAIQYGLTAMRMLDVWSDVYQAPENGTKGWADAPRTSDYFAIFHGASSTIVNQQADVVEAIVRFYTYLKMSRDAAAAVGGWEKQSPPDVGRRRHDIEHVVRLLCLCLLWGFIARHTMGQHPDKSDVDQLLDIARAMKLVLGDEAFQETFERLPRRDALERFFGVVGKSSTTSRR